MYNTLAAWSRQNHLERDPVRTDPQTWPREPTYRQRIEALRIVKNRHTEAKIELYGYFDTDDHGYIPWTEPIPFEAVPNHPSGGCYGIRAIGENFRRWLDVHPVYINPVSSLAGAWVYKGIPGVGGWRLATRQPQRAPARQINEFGDWFVPVEAPEGGVWGGGAMAMFGGSFSVQIEIQVTSELTGQPD